MQQELPEIYTLHNGRGPNYLIMSGTHGNESGPCGYLYHFIKDFHSLKKMLQPGTYTVIPVVNPLAVEANVRNLRGQPDVNRSYPNKSNITRYIDPLLRSANRVVDFHEAWGFNQCQPSSLGQTIYTNDASLKPLLQRTVDTLSTWNPNNKCDRWQLLDTLPSLDGVIDNYMNQLGKSYVLVEIAGQDNIQDRWVREDTTAFIMEDLFLLPQVWSKKYFNI